jgi:3-oxoacyl-[acyl-carrier-protein] synthase-3
MRAQLSAAEIDLVVCSTSTGEWSQPHTSAAIHGELGMRSNSAAWDLNAVCSGYVHALHAGASLLAADNSWNHVLVVGAERYSAITDPSDRRTRVLFGDGAGALVISRGAGDQRGQDSQRDTAPQLLGPLVSGTEFAGHEALIVPESEYFQMNGPAVRDFGTARIVQGLTGACERAGIAIGELDFIAPHQSNLRMLEAATGSLGLPLTKLLTSVTTAGNTASASIPITLSMSAESGALKAGMRVGVVGYGGGLSWAASTLRW